MCARAHKSVSRCEVSRVPLVCCVRRPFAISNHVDCYKLYGKMCTCTLTMHIRVYRTHHSPQGKIRTEKRPSALGSLLARSCMLLACSSPAWGPGGPGVVQCAVRPRCNADRRARYELLSWMSFAGLAGLQALALALETTRLYLQNPPRKNNNTEIAHGHHARSPFEPRSSSSLLLLLHT